MADVGASYLHAARRLVRDPRRDHGGHHVAQRDDARSVARGDHAGRGRLAPAMAGQVIRADGHADRRTHPHARRVASALLLSGQIPLALNIAVFALVAALFPAQPRAAAAAAAESGAVPLVTARIPLRVQRSRAVLSMARDGGADAALQLARDVGTLRRSRLRERVDAAARSRPRAVPWCGRCWAVLLPWHGGAAPAVRSRAVVAHGGAAGRIEHAEEAQLARARVLDAVHLAARAGRCTSPGRSAWTSRRPT